MILALTVGVLMAGAVYLMMRPDMFRIAIGFVLLSHAVNLILLATGGTTWRQEPFGVHDDAAVAAAADPLPQAFVLTAIVISFSISIVMLISAIVGKHGDATRPDDDTSDLPAELPNGELAAEVYEPLYPRQEASYE